MIQQNDTIGILLAGGTGSRLFPTTLAVSKHVLPIYDKPTIFYSLSMLMLAKVKTVVIICTQNDVKHYRNLLGDGSFIGMNIFYEIQNEPNGIAEAFLICREYVRNRSSMLVLGDNVFFGANLTKKLNEGRRSSAGATVFGYKVNRPQDFGIVELDESNRIISIVEKPEVPKSNIAVTGLYFYDNTAYDRVKELTPSARGELEISCLNRSYLRDDKLSIKMLERGIAWLDTGTPAGLLEASQFVETIEKRQGLKIACLEEIAFNNGWIPSTDLLLAGQKYRSTQYGQYLLELYRDNQFTAGNNSVSDFTFQH